MPSIAARTALATAFVGLGAAIGFALQLFLGITPLGSEGASRALSWALQDGAFLPADAYGDFVQFLDTPSTSPLKGGASRSFGGWRGQGFFAAVALQPQYMEENERIRGAWGYEQPEGRPGLPLRGSIVVDHPGLLESYQTIWVFGNEEDAIDWTIRNGGAEQNFTPHEARLLQVDDAVVVQAPPADGQMETRLGIVMRLSSLTTTLTFQGGAEVTFNNMLPLVQEALSRIRAECGGSHDA